jgi:hypothetical protein
LTAGTGIASMVLVVLAVLGLAWAATRPAHPDRAGSARSTPAPSVPASAAPAPTGVDLTDNGTTVILHWQGTGTGIIQYAILAAPAGTTPVLQQMTPGAASLATVGGLDAHADYCFQVAAVYPATLARSGTICTHR